MSADTDLVLTKTKELLEQLAYPAQAAVDYDQDSGYYQVQIDTDTPGLLIGYRGETLSAFQLMLGLIINQSTRQAGEEQDDRQSDKDWKKVVVNVGDYRQRREETLQQLAHNAAQRVSFSNEPYIFDRLTPAERRIVHMALKEHPEVETHSEGEGRARRLIVTPKWHTISSINSMSSWATPMLIGGVEGSAG